VDRDRRSRRLPARHAACVPAAPDIPRLVALAARLEAHAEAARAEAARLATAVLDTRWDGSAAHAFRFRAGLVIARLRTAAGQLDDAATALRSHAVRTGHAVAEAQHRPVH
jgi:hypothetical protein